MALSSRAKGILKNLAVFGLGAGIGVAATFGLRALTKRKPGRPNSVAYNPRTGQITWWTYPGGPVFRGPRGVMLQILKTGIRNRNQGIQMLLRALKAGQIRVVGRVS